MSNGYIYNAVYRNATKKDIYKAVMEYVNGIVQSRVRKFTEGYEKRQAKQNKEREKALQVALDWEREKTAKEIRNLLKTLKKKDDRLYTTQAHNNAIELAIRSIQL